MSDSLQTLDLEHLKTHPEDFPELTAQQYFSIDRERLEDIQLAAAQNRFAQLVQKIPMLRRLAEAQGISEIKQLDDLAPLLVPHSAYTSYPVSIVEKARFTALTNWLQNFTACDLSGFDASDCESIDDWIIAMDQATDIRLSHSTGTSGKLSFLPRTEEEWRRVQVVKMLRVFEGFGDEAGIDAITGFESLPYIYPGYRTGAMGHPRSAAIFEKYWHKGNGTPIITLHPGRLSADAVSLGGRIADAEAKGKLAELKITPELMARREQFLEDHKNANAAFAEFIEKAIAFKGQRIYMAALHPQFWDFTLECEQRGLHGLFAADSVFLCSGGMKGRTDVPDDWKARVEAVLGGRLREVYGMIEGMGTALLCEHNHFHFHPWIVLYLVDPKTGELLPRRGVQTGRLGIFDITPWTYWGGFLSGDKVTIDWADSGICSCGRQGPFLHAQISRLSENEGGDDKVTCAGAPEAHDRAMEYILKNLA